MKPAVFFLGLDSWKREIHGPNEQNCGGHISAPQFVAKNPNVFKIRNPKRPEALIFLTFFQKNSKNRLTKEGNSVILCKLARAGSEPRVSPVGCPAKPEPR
ncbi:MAG: hypothetical protein IJ153_04065 [Clostridia bacterium]|nr:hypothetical protein [Clostridia bacterium]